MSETNVGPDKKWTNLFGVVSVLALAGAIYSVIMVTMIHQRPAVKVGYIRSEALLSQYTPVIELQQRLQDETAGAQQDLEKRYKELEAMDADIKKKSEVLTMQALAPQIQRLQTKQNEFLQLQQNVQNQIAEKQNKALEPILQRINSFVTKYGKENGYTMIFGMPVPGMIVYGDPGEDLTDIIAAELNAQTPVNIPSPFQTKSDSTKK